MKRDFSEVLRDLEDKKNNDIILKKDKLLALFNEDEDLLEVVGQKRPIPLNKYVDNANPTEEEKKKRADIIAYNDSIKKTKRIVNFIKLNGIQQEVANYVMFDIDDYDVSVKNDVVKIQRLVVYCMVHEDNVDTEYGILRQDLLAYIVKDMLNWSNFLGIHLKLTNDYADIVDSKFYARVLKFNMEVPNQHKGGRINLYDKLP